MTEQVSVIIPVYNMEKYLDRCISSVIQQTYNILEIIIVDDGSTDKSADVCRKYLEADTRIRYNYQDNQGLGGARNTGMALSTSNYITFLDSDDWLENDFVEKMLASMLDNNADIVVCDIKYVDSITGVAQIAQNRLKKNAVLVSQDKSAVNKARMFAWGKIFKRDLIEKSNFRFPNIAYEDIVIPLLITQSETVCCVHEPLINYFRNREGSLCNDRNKINQITIGLQLLYDKFNELELYDKFILEYKKIVLAQLRFAYRKWYTDSDADVRKNLDELTVFLSNKFPHLNDITQKKFYVHGDGILHSAVDNSLPLSEQIIVDISTADYIVAYEHNLPKDYCGNAITVFVPRCAHGGDKVSAEFDLAELIMEQL